MFRVAWCWVVVDSTTSMVPVESQQAEVEPTTAEQSSTSAAAEPATLAASESSTTVVVEAEPASSVSASNVTETD